LSDNNKIYSFPPIINEKCGIIILGSMPGVESLRKNQYYGHPRNAFWRIMFDLLGREFTQDYAAKKRMLLENRIALWDVIVSCEREGSLDTKIRADEPNDFEALYRDYPNIKHVYFNGQKAYETYRRKVGFDKVRTFERLPSTSPAHAIGYNKKLDSWSKIINPKINVNY
jgi:TDG/mug DNA glycosylase family protein